MKFNLTNKELLKYLFYLVLLLYIWKVAKIKLKYIFPFLIFLMIFLYIEQNKKEDNTHFDAKIANIIEELYDEKYENLYDEEIVLFIDTLRPIRTFNIPVFNLFLSEMNVYMTARDIDNLLKTMNTFESLYFVIPVELTDFYTERFKALGVLLHGRLIEQKSRVEMQSYLPYDYIPNNFIH
jgi:hypothetical protein